MTTPIDVSPPIFYMSQNEKWPLFFDTTPLLALGEAPVSATSTLQNLQDSSFLTIAAPIVEGNTIEQDIDGPGNGLVGGQGYQLVINVVITDTKQPDMPLTIIVSY